MLTGKARSSYVYPPDLSNELISYADLIQSAKWKNKALSAKVRSSGDLAVDARLLV